MFVTLVWNGTVPHISHANVLTALVCMRFAGKDMRHGK